MVGNETRVKVVKNKVAPPFKQAEFQIFYGAGISKEGELVDLGVKHKLIDKAGPGTATTARRSARANQRDEALLRKQGTGCRVEALRELLLSARAGGGEPRLPNTPSLKPKTGSNKE